MSKEIYALHPKIMPNKGIYACSVRCVALKSNGRKIKKAGRKSLILRKSKIIYASAKFLADAFCLECEFLCLDPWLTNLGSHFSLGQLENHVS